MNHWFNASHVPGKTLNSGDRAVEGLPAAFPSLYIEFWAVKVAAEERKWSGGGVT